MWFDGTAQSGLQEIPPVKVGLSQEDRKRRESRPAASKPEDRGPTGSSNAKLEPKEAAEFRDAIKPRDHRIFFGAFDHAKLGFRDRMIAKLPAAKALFQEGDFRNWKDTEAWANSIAQALEPPLPQ